VRGTGRILLIEDDAGIRDTLAEILACEGYQVDEARDGAEGLARVGAGRPDLIVLDLVMPVMNGQQFLARLRADAATRDIPVVLMTGSPGSARALSDVAAVLPKPFGLDRLMEAVRRFGPRS